MSYSNPTVVCYQFAAFDFGAAVGDLEQGIMPPKGFENGRIIDVGVMNITETFAGGTSTAKVKVGSTANGAEYATLNVANTVAVAGSVFNTVGDPDAITEADILVSDLTGSLVEVTLEEATGSPAGQGQAFVVIGWY